MGAELGATTTVFPADNEVLRFLRVQGREQDYTPIAADKGLHYDIDESIDLGSLEPLIAMPSSPGNVVPVREVAGKQIYQAYIGSSANPGYRDFAVPAEMVKGRRVHERVSFDVCPTSRQVLEGLVKDGHLLSLIRAGARVHQAGCNGCIGMGQAPATGKLSLRTVPRNFPGRSGTRDDQVCLVSPETAAASALRGEISDPRTLDMPYPRIAEPSELDINEEMLIPPLPESDARNVELVKGPNIAALPEFEPLPDELTMTVLLKLGDDISTDEILPAGARVLPYRSNIPKISEFVFEPIDESYVGRARSQNGRGHCIVAGGNYGQGSSREHAALGPRYLGLRLVLAKTFARIHWQNLINFGILPLKFSDESVYDRINPGDKLFISHLHRQLQSGREIAVRIITQDSDFTALPNLSGRQRDVLLAGGLINWMSQRLQRPAVAR
jgi:aconitate hydratase